MAWVPFFKKDAPSIGAGASVKIDDSQFPFAAGVFYKNINIWVTTSANATYNLSALINGISQDSISISNQKTVCHYNLEHTILKDPNFKFECHVTNNSVSMISFVILITGEYYN